MKKSAYSLALIGLCIALSGCDKGKAFSSEDSCSSDTAKSTIRDLLVTAVEDSAREENKRSASNPDALRFDLAKIRATTSQIGIDLADVMTSKNDPNSTKKFCEAKITFSIPTTVLQDANSLRKDVNEITIQSAAEDAGFRVEADRFSHKISYSVQPTDDKAKLYTSVDGIGQYTGLLTMVVQYAALKSLRAEQLGVSLQAVQAQAMQEKAAAAQQAVITAAQEAAAQSAAETVVVANAASVRPSFDCTKASTEVEKAICADPILAAADARLAKLYKESMASTLWPDELKQGQKIWVTTVRNKCEDAICILKAYEKRMSEIDVAEETDDH